MMRVKYKQLQSARRRALIQSAAVPALIVSIGMLAPVVVSAQTSSPPPPSEELQEFIPNIVVTATRQAVASQSVPISLTAIGADQLASAGLTSTAELAQLSPSMTVLSSVSAGSMRFSLRGISNNDFLAAGSSAVATYVDDVYQASLFGISPALFDLQRVEVMRGPQGTTFGKNTTGGAVAYFSQLPVNEFEAYAKARVAGGYRPERSVEGAVNLPLVDDKLAMRVSLTGTDQSDYLRDLGSGHDRGGAESQAGRVQLRWTPTDDTGVNLTVLGSRLRGDTALARAEILPVNDFFFDPPRPLRIDEVDFTPYDLYDEFDNSGATLRIEQALGSFGLTAISHYRRTKVRQAQDVDALPEDIFLFLSNSTSTQYGQEVRIASDSTQRLSGLVGVYFEKDKVEETANESATFPTAMFGEYNNLAHYQTRTTTYAAFVNLTFRMTDQLSVIGGLRKSSEDRKHHGDKSYFQTSGYDWTQDNVVFTGPPPVAPDFPPLDYALKQKSTPWTWDATVNYNPSSSFLLFARAAKGFRSGGFNPAAAMYPFFPFAPFEPATFDGESVKSYEIGMKSSFLDRKMRLNASVFHYDYADMQVTTYPNAQATTTNAASSKIDGGEVEVMFYPTARLELQGSVGYTDAQYEDFVVIPGVLDNTGNQLIQAPEWTLNASVTYTMPLSDSFDLVANTNWSYRSEVFWTSDNIDDFRAEPMSIGNARLGVQSTDKGFSVAAFVNNMTDEVPLESGFGFGAGYNLKYFGIGRIYGAELSYKW